MAHQKRTYTYQCATESCPVQDILTALPMVWRCPLCQGELRRVEARAREGHTCHLTD